MQIRTAILSALCIGILAALGGSGCSVTGAASTGYGMFKNSKSGKLESIVYIDGQEAKRNEMKQAATGSSKYKVKEPVGTSPTFKYELKDPTTTGRISYTGIQVHKKVGKGWSDQAEYVLSPVSQDASGQLKPGNTYNLASPGPGFRIADWQGKPVSGMTFEPGTEYMLQFVLRADSSDTATIYFTTR